MTSRDVIPHQPLRTGDQDSPARRLGGLSFTGALEVADSPGDALDLMVLDGFVSGREPFAHTVRLEHVVPDAALRPDGAHVLRESVTEDCVSRVSGGEGWSLLSSHWKQSRRATLVVTAATHELAEQVAGQASQGAVNAPPPTPERVPIGFWHLTPHGAQRTERDIDATPWEDLRGNYPQRAALAVDTLMRMTSASVAGRLLLLHGPPGTGKTTLLRGLARSWRSWCQVDCVLDPEVLFANPSYLLQVALGSADDDEDGEERWRLMLLEDCDELIHAEAKNNSGQALSRLLNLTDGLLGQGRKVLVAITTNEDLTRLHPAVTRPGRSLAHLEIGRLSPDECRTWLAGGRHRPTAPDAADDPDATDATDATDGPGEPVRLTEAMLRDGATLAELYALRSGHSPVAVTEEPPGYGCYL